MIWDILLDWLVPFTREHLFRYRDTILEKETTSIYRKPPVGANSKLFWNTADQIMCYPKKDIVFIHQSKNLKQKVPQMVHPGKSELPVPNYVHNQHII